MKRLERSHKKGRRWYFNFICECGSTVIRRSDSKAKYCSEPYCKFSIKNNTGHGRDRLYVIWEGIRSRVVTRSHHSAKSYTKINLCTDWEVHQVFRDWALSSGYKNNLTIDRINIDGDYEPSNCEWVTREENTRRQIKDHHSNEVSIFVDGKYFYSKKQAIDFLKEGKLYYLARKTLGIYIKQALDGEDNTLTKHYSIQKAGKWS